MATAPRSPARGKSRAAQVFNAFDANLRALLPMIGGLERRAYKVLFRDCACEGELYGETIIVHVCPQHDGPCMAMLAAQFDATGVA